MPWYEFCVRREKEARGYFSFLALKLQPTEILRRASVKFPGNRSQVEMGSKRRVTDVKGAERNLSAFCHAAFLLFSMLNPAAQIPLATCLAEILISQRCGWRRGHRASAVTAAHLAPCKDTKSFRA